MSYDILQKPTSPNVQGTELLYTVSSSNAGNPQFRYIAQVDGGFITPYYSTKLKTYPNENLTGTFDISRIYRDMLVNGTLIDQADNSFIMGPGTIAGSSAIFNADVYFGEVYGSSLNDTPTEYLNITQSLDTYILRTGFKNINDNVGNGYNWDSGSYYYTGTTPVKFLSSNPSMYTTTDDLDFKYQLGYNSSYGATVLMEYTHSLTTTVQGYDFNDSLVSTDSYTMSSVSSTLPILRQVAVGPFNLRYATAWPNISPKIYNQEIKYYTVSTDRTNETLKVYIDYECDYNTPQDYAWIGENGNWEYAYIKTPLKRTTDIKRNEYDRTFVRYEDRLPSYNQSNRGKSQYYTEYGDTYEVTTDWLTKEQADWFKQMFESPYVVTNRHYRYRGAWTYLDFNIPIYITNTSYRVNNSTSRNKLFQYTFTFKQSKPRNSR